MKKKALLVVGIIFGSETQTISAALYYIKNRIKLDSITYQVKFEDKKY